MTYIGGIKKNLVAKQRFHKGAEDQVFGIHDRKLFGLTWQKL